MRFEETRDNTTAIENQSIEADAHVDTREGVEGSDPTGRETWRERKLRLAEATFGKVGSSRMSRAMENRDNTTAIEATIIAADADENHPCGGDNDAWHGNTTREDNEPEDGDESAADYDEGWPPVGGGHFNDGMW